MNDTDAANSDHRTSTQKLSALYDALVGEIIQDPLTPEQQEELRQFSSILKDS